MPSDCHPLWVPATSVGVAGRRQRATSVEPALTPGSVPLVGGTLDSECL